MEGSTLLVYFCRNWTRLSQISSSTSSLLKCLTQFCCYFFCFVYALHLSTVTSVILSSQFPLDGVQSDYFFPGKTIQSKRCKFVSLFFCCCCLVRSLEYECQLNYSNPSVLKFIDHDQSRREKKIQELTISRAQIQV